MNKEVLGNTILDLEKTLFSLAPNAEKIYNLINSLKALIDEENNQDKAKQDKKDKAKLKDNDKGNT